MNDGFGEFKKRLRLGVEDALRGYLEAYAPSEVRRVAEYAVLGGGHRWRAMAAVAAGLVFHDDAFDVCMPSACSFELAHAASLVLDDLPCMDDARFRRGKPCAHLVFAPWAVALAPSFMVSTAYEITLASPLAAPERRVQAALVVAEAAEAMCRGQESDITDRAEDRTDDGLLGRYRLKTGALYAAATKAGAILGGADPEDAAALGECGMHLGLAVQFLDDTADVLAGVAEAGKEAGRDGGKVTATDLYGVEGARSRAAQFQEIALSKLQRFRPTADTLRNLISHANWEAD
jgi:geranylgeranyl pyrophosphate synthase